MRSFLSSALLVGGMLSPASAFAKSVMIDGVITRIDSPTEFEIGTVHVFTDQQTRSGLSNRTREILGPFAAETIHIGNIVRVEGSESAANHIAASKIHVYMPYGEVIEDTALLQKTATLSPAGSGYAGTFWVGGYPLTVTPKTKLSGPNGSPFTISLLKANTWVTFKATRTYDDGILAESLIFVPAESDEKEMKYRTDTQFKMTEPDYASNKPGQVHLRLCPDFFIPADKDLQDYVQALGVSLIPAFQKELPVTDNNRIPFRFFVVDHSSSAYPDPIVTPGGDVLIPGRVLLRVKDESQLAARLASAIAYALERLQYVHKNRIATQTALGTGSSVASWVFISAVPLAGGVIGIANAVSYKNLMIEMNKRSNRVGLMYMEEAGYDLMGMPLSLQALSNHVFKNPVATGDHPKELVQAALEAVSDHAVTTQPSVRNDEELHKAQERLRKLDPKLKP